MEEEAMKIKHETHHEIIQCEIEYEEQTSEMIKTESMEALEQLGTYCLTNYFYSTIIQRRVSFHLVFSSTSRN